MIFQHKTYFLIMLVWLLVPYFCIYKRKVTSNQAVAMLIGGTLLIDSVLRLFNL